MSIDIMALPMNCVAVILVGVTKLRELPERREYKIVTHQGNVRRMRTEREKSFEERRVI
nr:XtrA/YqaO family protein [Sporosarcina sp. P16b]